MQISAKNYKKKANFLGWSFGIVLASSRVRFGVVLIPILMSFLPYVWAVLARFLGHFYGHFAGFFWWFWEVDCHIKQNDVREGKNNQISAKFHQNMQNCAKTSPLFRL